MEVGAVDFFEVTVRQISLTRECGKFISDFKHRLKLITHTHRISSGNFRIFSGGFSFERFQGSIFLVTPIPPSFRALLESFVTAALDAVNPSAAALNQAKRIGSKLRVGRKIFDLRRFDEVRLVAVGKAAVPLAGAVIPLIQDKLSRGVVVTKKGFTTRTDPVREYFTKNKIILMEGSHPEPDESSLRCGKAIAAAVANCSGKTLLLCCISGGASSLAILPKLGITLKSYRRVNSLLLASGADIVSVNGVRKALDELKGGGLARLAAPAQIASLIISDVIGDPIPVIASGLTDAPGVQNFIVANNTLACQAVARAARKAGFKPVIITTGLKGEARKAGAQIAQEITRAPSKSCHIYGGETTVTLGKKSGFGGRNQELVLAAAIELGKSSTSAQIALASFGTDGIDGRSPAAGAFCTGETIAKAKSLKLSPRKLLREHNSHVFFKKLDQLIVTGQTGTNVADVVVAVKD